MIERDYNADRVAAVAAALADVKLHAVKAPPDPSVRRQLTRKLDDLLTQLMGPQTPAQPSPRPADRRR